MPRQRCKSGCITCRIRRVKCDEAKPSCNRCTSTGRKCDGYENTNAKDEYRQSGIHHHSLIGTISRAPASTYINSDLRYLQYFQQHAAPALAASFNSDFWNTLVLQVSDSQTPVRNAIIAFSSLHEDYERGIVHGPGAIPSDGNHLRALNQYNLAVRQTAQLLNLNDAASCRVVLVSCLLFVCVELLQDNYSRAIDHLIAGLRMILFCQSAARDTPSLTSLSSLNNSLGQFFGRIVVQTMFLGDTHFDVRVIPKIHQIDRPAAFSTVTEAKDSLDILFLSTYPFLHLMARDPGHELGKFYQTQLLDELQNWNRLFHHFVDAGQASFTLKDSTGAILLEIHSTSLLIMLDTALDEPNTLQNNSAPRFLRIISLVESLLTPQNQSSSSSHGSASSKLPHYSFDLGVIGPLFYTAVRCWNPTIRSKVISLLRHPNIPRREGMYNAEMTAIIAQRVMDMEEEFLRSSANSDAKEPQLEELKKKVWFDIERPTEDTKKLKILVGEIGAKHRMKEERREEVVHW